MLKIGERIKMEYKFHCSHCKKDFLIDIPIRDYDKEKTNQFCKNCGNPLRRVLEWNGIAEGSGAGWYGKKGSNVI